MLIFIVLYGIFQECTRWDYVLYSVSTGWGLFDSIYLDICTRAIRQMVLLNHCLNSQLKCRFLNLNRCCTEFMQISSWCVYFMMRKRFEKRNNIWPKNTPINHMLLTNIGKIYSQWGINALIDDYFENTSGFFTKHCFNEQDLLII